MYPPAQYARLPTEEGELSLPPSGSAPSKLRRILSSRSFLRTAVIGFGLFLLVLVFGKFAHNFLGGSAWTTAPHPTPHMKEDWTDEAFRFKNESKPLWLLDPPAGGPLVLNIAVISRVDEFDRRKDIREAIFEGVRPTDVKFEYRFFVGAPKEDSEGKKLHSRLLEENKYYNDVEILENIPDIPERISEKRYAAFEWSGEMPSKEYDYFFTLDSDTFVRLGALARRMPVFLAGKNIKPREQPILIGRMSVHWVHFYNTVPDGNKNATDEDEYIRGPWYEYPMGIGYMISSSLVDTFLSTTPLLPHHIHYPSDDVMIGTWISALRLFPNQTIEFETTDPHLHDEPVHKVIPPPYLPHVVDTNIIDDKEGWHNFVGRWSHDGPVSWSSVCVHHVNGDEMRVLRRMEYIRDEWEDSYDISA